MIETTRSAHGGPSLRILLAEDSTTVRAAIGHLLVLLGHEVDSVCDGAEALTALRRNAYDAALIDVEMPVLGGPEAVTRFRRGPRSSKPPYLIFISADDSPGERRRCAESGMDDFLPKPILASQLANALGRMATSLEESSAI